MLNEQGFDLWADGYEADVGQSDAEGSYPFAGYRKVLGTIYRAVRALPAARRVLDVGCGTAVLSARLYRDGYEITGVDFSPRMIELAREKMPGARLVQHDLTLGLPEALLCERFDAIVSTYALHHLTDAQKAGLLRALLGLLRPGGKLLIGDVAFADRRRLEECRAASGDRWDEDEIYFAADEWAGAAFAQCSPCAGVLTFEPRGARRPCEE
jgi:putative AdoMet-dependent methyltransferase